MKLDFSNPISLEHLDSLVRSHPENEIREEAFAHLCKLRNYSDANEWKEVVLACEILAIVGWGDYEPLNATAHYNGDCWETSLTTYHEDLRLRHARWKKRKAGWLIFNPEYHESPDLPDHPSVDWKKFAGMDFPIVDIDSLATQRNPMARMPIVMGLIGGSCGLSNRINCIRNELKQLLLEGLFSDEYGSGLKKFYFRLNAPHTNKSNSSELKIGPYKPSTESFHSELYFGEEWNERSDSELKLFLGSSLMQAVGELKTRMTKKNSTFKIELFEKDLAEVTNQLN